MTTYKPALRNATPRPWALDTIEGGGWAVVIDADTDGAKVIAELDDTYGDRAANAALIVEAVNSYRADNDQRCGVEYEPDRICRRDKGHAGDHSRVRWNADEDESLR